MRVSIIQQGGNMSNIFSIRGKVILLTGATGYLGSKMVEMLSQKGAIVIVLSRNIDKAKNLCIKLDIPIAQAFEIDVSDNNSVTKTVKEIFQKFSKIDILVNNAYFVVTKLFNQYTKEDWKESFEGTVISIDIMTQAVIPYMKNNSKGRIINISSMYGMVSPNPDVYSSEEMINPLSYGVGKAGVIQYTKYSAMKLAQYDITVNSVSYGPFPNINIVKDKKFLTKLADKTFVKRIGKPEEVTSAIYFLSLDESSYVTGQNIVVDGGWTSW